MRIATLFCLTLGMKKGQCCHVFKSLQLIKLVPKQRDIHDGQGERKRDPHNSFSLGRNSKTLLYKLQVHGRILLDSVVFTETTV